MRQSQEGHTGSTKREGQLNNGRTDIINAIGLQNIFHDWGLTIDAYDGAKTRISTREKSIF